jgi:hypothetical protein
MAHSNPWLPLSSASVKVARLPKLIIPGGSLSSNLYLVNAIDIFDTSTKLWQQTVISFSSAWSDGLIAIPITVLLSLQDVL